MTPDSRFDDMARAEPTAAPRLDVSTPSSARMYDYYLGGKDNFAADRKAADQAIAINPETPRGARNNRGFLRRAVQFLAEQGVDQFIDLGTGIPTRPNVHEVARAVVPDARVVYVDNDPVVTTHTRALRATHPGVVAVEADIRDPRAILTDPTLTATLDLRRPVAVLMIAVLHFLDDQQARHLLDAVHDATVPGSWLAMSLATSENVPPQVMAAADENYRTSSSGRFVFRSREQVTSLFDGYDLVEPGVADIAQWRGTDTPTKITCLAGVGHRL